MNSIFMVTLISVMLGMAPLSRAADAESTSKTYDEMSLEELMNVKVTVATSKPTTINRTPGIVTLITADDIAHMGARDLYDVLMTVPGFSIGEDSLGATGAGFRGLWAYLGKALYLIDDQVMNDGMFQTMVLSHRLPISLIDRIEIIRGPGSVRYGRNAELAVIKITTKLATHSRPEVDLAGGQQKGGTGEAQIEGLYTKYGENVGGGALFSYKHGGQGEGTVTDSTGANMDFTNHSQIDDKFAEAQLNVGKFSGQVIYDQYVQRDQTGAGFNIPEPVPNRFNSALVRGTYDIDVTPSIKIKPYVEYRWDRPWQWIDLAGIQFYNVSYDRSVEHYEVGANMTFDQSADLEWLFGVQAYQENATDHRGTLFRHDNSLNVKLDDLAVYAEARYDMKWAELTAGVRADINAAYGGAVVPRIALVKEYEKWGYKVLLSEGYTPPGLEEIEDESPGTTIKPETTTVAEIELSRRLGEKSAVALNIYSMSISNPIIYNFSSTQNNYENFEKVGSDGVELTYQYRDSLNNLRASFSFSHPDGRINYWSVPNHDGSFLGLENTKATLQDTFKLSGGMYFTPTFIFVGQRYGQDYSTAANALVIREFDPVYYLNAVAEKRDFFRKDLNVSLGVYNILGQDYRILQANNSGSEPLPSPSTEYLLKLSSIF